MKIVCAYTCDRAYRQTCQNLFILMVAYIVAQILPVEKNYKTTITSQIYYTIFLFPPFIFMLH